MNKITEIILEPGKVYAGSIFLLKIKATRYLTYGELKELTVNRVKDFTVTELKGD